MKVKCSTCGNDTFYVEKIIQYNGSDDTLEIICTKCGDFYGYDVIL